MGGVAASPRSVKAQQDEPVRRVGVLNILGPDDPEAQARNTVLAPIGWVVGRNLVIDARLVGGDFDLVRRYAAELGRGLINAQP